MLEQVRSIQALQLPDMSHVRPARMAGRKLQPKETSPAGALAHLLAVIQRLEFVIASKESELKLLRIAIRNKLKRKRRRGGCDEVTPYK